MSKSNDYENALLQLAFNGTPIPGLADNAAASPATSLYIALHSADPGEDGKQNTSEITYTGYARAPVTRNPAGWVVTGSVVSPANSVEFGEMTGGTAGTATHMTIGTQSTGAGMVLYRGPITPEIPYAEGVAPRIRASSTIEED